VKKETNKDDVGEALSLLSETLRVWITRGKMTIATGCAAIKNGSAAHAYQN